MKFVLIDKIERIEAGKSLRAIKNLSLAEEYLADHFPTFPVLPGVLMLEAMVQSAAWLVRVTQDYKNSVIVLRQAKNVSYGTFVAPGNTMTVEIEALEIGEKASKFKAQCSMGELNVVKARLELEHYNVADRHAGWGEQDATLVQHFKSQFRLLGGPAAVTA